MHNWNINCKINKLWNRSIACKLFQNRISKVGFWKGSQSSIVNTFESKCIFLKGLHCICLLKKDTKAWALKWLISAWIWIWLMITDGKIKFTYIVWYNNSVVMRNFIYRSPLHISIDKGFEDLSIHLIESGAKWDIEFPGGR